MEELKMRANYDANSDPQLHFSEPLNRYFSDALAEYSSRESITIADFGSATGLNSCKTFKPALEKFRESSAATVQVFHCDLPGNHWSTLFTNLHSSPQTYQSVPDVFSYAAGQSFYKRCFPNAAVDISYASSAFHWLSEPSQGRNQLFPIIGRFDDFETDVHQRIPRDLDIVLRHRAAELRPGGHLIFNLPERKLVGKLFFTPLIEVAYQMQERNEISAKYLESIGYPFGAREMEENLKTIGSIGAFEVVSTEVVSEENPLYQAFVKNGDIDAYAKAFVGFTKGFLYHYLLSTCRGGQHGEELLNRFFDNVETHVRGHPEPIYQSLGLYHLRKIENI